ncbi:hypothetical protein HER10_EVM0005947 [Colletotrichum scovillei]|uniref:Uncharacterized protein n=1 Tax=Colletotrichum scovillei TaxID=1209932 RepID=A0A9P7R906_9PEZI|nr:uncharacterized protein HER10_EVM0005947 [Colletotrichum scovillei]KAF4783075.1 hypothetical protein HER10_EVM0005947 [Colletotrichum scovillei]KAG7053076.1 hypothetical protein JMJ77_0000168 [Colletotrichum scovillei]KAG7071370.1 hypothetical protein JMJ76_0004243 [Colletotrichum scovillei]KAG7079590.1 hypothetical protein JMJ78_0006696 [Colletotrichum scovillei]
MCVSGQVICECDWPRDTVRHCTKYVQTGELCPGTSKCLLPNTERRKTEGGVYKCSNPACEIWDLEMCRGIRERGKYMDRQMSLTLGQWMKKEEEAEKASMALMNEANPVESGGEGHASIVVIPDDSDSDDDDNDEGLEALLQLALAEAQDIVESIPDSILKKPEVFLKPEVDVPELEVEESTTDDLESLFGGSSSPPTPDMRLVKNHHTICLPTESHLPSPVLSQPTPADPVKEGDSQTPPADTKSEQSTPVILPAQAPVQHQPAPQVPQKPASTYPAQNTMAMGNKMPISYPAVPQHMRPTLSGPNQATLRALRAQTPRRGSGRPMIPARGMPIQNGYTASPQVSQGPVPTYPGQNTMAMGNDMAVSHQQPTVPQAHARAAPAQGALMAARFGCRMPGSGIQNTAAMGAGVGMGMGNTMPNCGGQGMSLAMSAQPTGPQGMPSQYVAYQNMPPQRVPPGFPNFIQSPQMPYQGMPAQGMLPQGMPPNGMPTQGFPPQNGYMPSPAIPQMRTRPMRGLASNGMPAQQGYMNPAYMANGAAPLQYAGPRSPMVGTASAQAPAGVAPFPRASTGSMFLQSQPQPQFPNQPQPLIPPFFNSRIWDQSQAQNASRPQMASGMPGMPPAQGTIAGSGPATGQKRSHNAISTGYTDPRLSQPPLTPGGMPITSPANTPPSVDGERQTKRRAM